MAQQGRPPTTTGTTTEDDRPRPGRRWPAVMALVSSAALVLFVVAMIPVVVHSLGRDLAFAAPEQVYDLRTVERIELTGGDQAREGSYLDLGVTSITESTLEMDIVVSGQRTCGPGACPEFVMTFFSIPENRGTMGGVSPSASVTVPGVTGPFSQTIILPVAGDPVWYPFDRYSLTLGATIAVKDGGGNLVAVPPASGPDLDAAVTLQNRLPGLNLVSLDRLDPASIRSGTGSSPLLWSYGLTFSRPRYLKVVAGLLVLLITASSLFSLFLRNARDSVLGIGALVFGIWSVRSVIVKGDLPDVTVVDIALSMTMVVFLLVLWIRVTIHFWQLWRPPADAPPDDDTP